MKKEYVKPQNRVVELKDKLMQGFGETSIPEDVPFDAKQNGFNSGNDDSDGSDSSSDVWED